MGFSGTFGGLSGAWKTCRSCSWAGSGNGPGSVPFSAARRACSCQSASVALSRREYVRAASASVLGG